MDAHKVMGIIGLIALRKSGLYYKIIDEFPEKDKKKIKEHIAEMKNDIFLSKGEKESAKIKPELKIEDLDIDIKTIINEIKFYFSTPSREPRRINWGKSYF